MDTDSSPEISRRDSEKGYDSPVFIADAMRRDRKVVPSIVIAIDEVKNSTINSTGNAKNIHEIGFDELEPFVSSIVDSKDDPREVATTEASLSSSSIDSKETSSSGSDLSNQIQPDYCVTPCLPQERPLIKIPSRVANRPSVVQEESDEETLSDDRPSGVQQLKAVAAGGKTRHVDILSSSAFGDACRRLPSIDLSSVKLAPCGSDSAVLLRPDQMTRHVLSTEGLQWSPLGPPTPVAQDQPPTPQNNQPSDVAGQQPSLSTTPLPVGARPLRVSKSDQRFTGSGSCPLKRAVQFLNEHHSCLAHAPSHWLDTPVARRPYRRSPHQGDREGAGKTPRLCLLGRSGMSRQVDALLDLDASSGVENCNDCQDEEEKPVVLTGQMQIETLTLSGSEKPITHRSSACDHLLTSSWSQTIPTRVLHVRQRPVRQLTAEEEAEVAAMEAWIGTIPLTSPRR